MIKDIKKLLNITASVVMGSLILWNCEPDADQLGSQFFQGGAEGVRDSLDLVAYNVFNNDMIRTDASRLQSATLGAFKEPQFGLQKSSYVSQVRLSSYSPDFGTNAVLDSAVLVIQPSLALDSVKTTTVEDYIFPDGAVPAKKVVSTYPVLKYGKTKIDGRTLFNIKVQEVTEFLAASTDSVMSNKVASVSNVIGGRMFNGDVSAVKITKDTDNSDLYVREATLRIPMDSAFFQTKIIAKGGSPDLADAASFIRYFRGVKISVDQTDGYLFNFDPNSVVINLYYKKDIVTDGTTSREDGVFSLDLGASNVHFNEITFDRASTPSAIVSLPQDTIQGMPKLYAQGMGGPGIGLRIPESSLANLRSLYTNEKIGIISAKIRLYTDTQSWSNNYKKPNYFVVKQKTVSKFLEDITTLAYTPGFALVRSYNLDKNSAYYDITVTQTIKNMVEKLVPAEDFVLDVGTYTTDVTGGLAGLQDPEKAQNYNTRAYTPNRVVLVGSEAGNAKRAKLILTYGKK